MTGRIHTKTCSAFVDDSIGLTMQGVTWKEGTDSFGKHYWQATQQIGTMFGAEVQGEIEAIGLTKEIALERLAVERKKLNDSMWE